MSLPSVPYPYGVAAALGAVDLGAATVKAAILGDSHTFDPAHQRFADVDAGEVSGVGYTAGGAEVDGVGLTVTQANAWPTVWSGQSGYEVGDLVRPTTGNGRLYRCVAAGTSAASEPSWPTAAATTVDDGTVTWAEAGIAAVGLDGDDVTWDEVTFNGGASVQVYVDGAAGVDDWLIAHLDFGETLSPDGEEFRVEWPAGGLVVTTIRG